jgi:simple sugar transport system ATP-binding protein
LRELRNAGVAVVIVTHKLREVMEVADRVVVLSRGQVTGEFLISGAGHRPALEQDILAAMFHRQGSVTRWPLDNPTNEVESIDGPPILTVRGLGSSGIRDVSFDLRAGEVAMMVGIDGNGQRALAEAIAGYRSSTGSVRLRGEDIAHLGAEARARRGISFLTDDRVGEGGVAAMTVADNVVLKRPAPRDGRASLARKVVSSWRVTPSDIDAPFGTLSGGNMQRVLIGRELARNPSVLIALNPAYGLDAETATTVWSRFRVFARNGAGVLVLTSDLDEALAHGDRVAVMRSGAVSGFEPVRAANRSKLGSQMVLGW